MVHDVMNGARLSDIKHAHGKVPSECGRLRCFTPSLYLEQLVAAGATLTGSSSWCPAAQDVCRPLVDPALISALVVTINSCKAQTYHVVPAHLPAPRSRWPPKRQPAACNALPFGRFGAVDACGDATGVDLNAQSR
jgi:hypothetical protein